MTPRIGSTTQLAWVTLRRYCELSGESRWTVYERRNKGTWREGVHCQKRGRMLYINLPEIEKWIVKGKQH